MDNEEQNQFQELGELVATGTHQEILSLMSELKPEQLADLLESSPVAERKVLWDLCDPDLQSEVLEQIDDELAPALLEDKSATEIAGVLENVEDDDSTDILQQLPVTLTRQVLEAMDTQDRRRMENLLSYQEDTAAGLMNTDTISVRPQVTVDVVLRYLRRHNELPKTTDKIFVVNTNDVFIGLIPLTTLLVSKPSLSVYDIMITEAQTIAADLPEHDVAQIFERYDLVSAPVLDEGDRLLGRITIDDVVDVIIEEADHSILGMAGLAESEDRFGKILRTARSRAVWLGANLITAFMAAYVIDIFKDTIEKVVALAVLMPIVASMGGVAGSQTLTLAIRNMAQDELFDTHLGWLTRRQVAVGTVNGCLWAIVAAVAASLFFQDQNLGIIIAVALIINLVVAALAGTLLPSFLRSIRIDPAIAGTVVLTTVTDVVGFLSFLGLATWFYA